MPTNGDHDSLPEQSDTSSNSVRVEFQWDPTDKAFVLSTSVLLPRCRTEVFDFFSDAFQLERITPKWLNFKILTPAPIAMRTGCLIDYKISLRGVPLRWKTEISSWDPPFSFTDRQLKGPYLLWEHLHTFEETQGGTLMSDRVRYRVLGGRLVNWAFVQDDLNKIFSYRGHRMLELFPTVSSSALASDRPSGASDHFSIHPSCDCAGTMQTGVQGHVEDLAKRQGLRS